MKDYSKKEIQLAESMLESQGFLMFEDYINSVIMRLRDEAEAPVQPGMEGILNQQQLLGGIQRLKNLKLDFASELTIQKESTDNVEE